MRNIKILFALVAVTALFSCKKFLNQEPITQVSPSFVFGTIEDARRTIAGVYQQLTGDQGYGIRLSLYYTVDNDETYGPPPSAQNPSDGDRRDMCRYNLTPTNAQLTRPFNQLFTGIEYANICIEEIPKSVLYNSGTDKEKKQMRRMLGEALTLRAQFYLEAIRNWGDLPMHFQSAAPQIGVNQYPARVDRDIIYDKLLDDLKTAATLLPWRSELASFGDGIDERITAGTAHALRARIALFRGGYSLRNNSGIIERKSDYLTYYQMAKDACKIIMDKNEHRLNPSYRALWKDQVCAHAVADPDGELMFQATGIGGGSPADTKLGYYNGPTINAKGNKSINVLPTYLYQFDSSDLRRDVTIAPYTATTNSANDLAKVGTGLDGLVDGKYRRDWISNPSIPHFSDVQYFGLSWQILRYSDVLLMFAEAENEINGPTGQAYEAINMVRRRGFGKPVNAPTVGVDLAGLSKQQFFDAIVAERSLEFGGEGIRKYDLIRWNLLGNKIAQTKTWLNAMAVAAPATLPVGCGPYGGIITLPKAMYSITGSIADDKTIWINTYYSLGPSSTPAGSSKKTWYDLSSGTHIINTKILNVVSGATTIPRYAGFFTPNKSELMPIPTTAINANPNLTQNPGY